MSETPGRLAALDGLRGWAALSVVVYHFTWQLFSGLYPGFASLPVSFLGNGGLAVAIFFVLSGYVLTLRRWRRPDNGVLPLVLVRRYVRLGIPVTGAVLVAWALMSLGLTPTQPAAEIVHGEPWLGRFVNFEPDIGDALWFAAVRTYWFPSEPNYGPFLWTMMFELFGSFVVLVLSHWSRGRLWPYAALLFLSAFMLTAFPLAACFGAGALIALLQSDGHIFSKPPSAQESVFATAVFVIVLLVAAWVQLNVPSLYFEVAMSIVIFVCVCRSGVLERLLSAPLSRWLGRVSFPLYLLQFAVVISIGAGLILWSNGAGLLSWPVAVAISLAGIAACLVAAWAYTPVEDLTLRLVRRIGGRSRD